MPETVEYHVKKINEIERGFHFKPDVIRKHIRALHDIGSKKAFEALIDHGIGSTYFSTPDVVFSAIKKLTPTNPKFVERIRKYGMDGHSTQVLIRCIKVLGALDAEKGGALIAEKRLFKIFHDDVKTRTKLSAVQALGDIGGKSILVGLMKESGNHIPLINRKIKNSIERIQKRPNLAPRYVLMDPENIHVEIDHELERVMIQ